VVNAYRGLWTRCIGLDQWYTRPAPAGQDRVHTQNWHRDKGDLGVVRVFLYFSEVDGTSGALEYVRGSAGGGPYGHLWPWSLSSQKFPSPEELERAVPHRDRIQACGPPGTIVFSDGSGLHRGGFAVKRPRVLSHHTYVSPAAVASGHRARHFVADLTRASTLPEAARFALG
jgi:hypothetical protein